MASHLKCILLCATGSIFFASSSVAQDSGGYYIKGFGGLSSLQGDTFTLGGTPGSLSFDSGSTLGGAVGYRYADSPFRAEVEFAYRSGDVTDLPTTAGTGGDFASTSIMLNGYYVFESSTKLKPYVGLGIGYVTEIDFDIEGGSGAGEYNDRGLLGYQAMLGVEYSLSNSFAIYGEARYFSAGSAGLVGPGGTGLSADYDALDLIAGLTFKF